MTAPQNAPSASERWDRAQALFHTALELPGPARTEFLATAAGADAALRAEVESLLAADEAVPAFLDQRLVALPPQLLSLVDGTAARAGRPGLRPGDRVGAYHLDRELGQGGMGVVYLARHDARPGRLALKALAARGAPPSVPERFRREVRVAVRLRHPNVLPVLESGESADLLWFTMPWIEGGSLRERLRREGALPVADALRIARDVARALQHAHERGIVHRDVKPENVLLTAGGTAILADFGISRRFRPASPGWDVDAEPLTMTGVRLGTPAYMSPEQACGDRVDERSDVYSLACLVHELLTGEVAFGGPTPREIFARRMGTPPPSARARRPEVPAAVDEALRLALARSPGARPASAAAFARALGGP